MRTGLIAALAAILVVATSQADEPRLDGAGGEALSSREISRWLLRIQKPTRGGDISTSSYRGVDTCQWANDGECDDPGIGTGACDQGTDYSDCWRIADNVEDDSCQWANDGECDEPGFGTGACTQATDLTDCGAIIDLRFRNDSCDTAFDGVCNEPGLGDGRCDARTDRADCFGRDRPLTINDHYFGHDDRVFMDTAASPWNAIGQIDLDSGGACTATLIADNVLITASHCINEDGRTDASAVFRTAYDRPGGPLEARVTAYLIDPDWDEEAFGAGNDLDGTDWALLRIDRPLGAEIGHVGVRGLVQNAGNRTAMRADLYQAGYSWDTGAHLSGNIGCHMVEIFNDNTMAHNCDTTRGDSGSPFMIREGNQYFVVGTDSNFRPTPGEPMKYIAVRSEAWLPYYDDFVAGRIGHGGASPMPSGKPLK
ncbi:trypsin-like serine protease [uncultured Maricaulis sp.]|uniref:trypsin-like serine peptidase n=1 Tax=uncultured Maricaulis sp. TaxID=174710 RepID=UPI0030DC30B1|tara:strand:- start:17158 stop:18435 length:1278 start_codon:yes stop_codon:yes gene_type:complete